MPYTAGSVCGDVYLMINRVLVQSATIEDWARQIGVREELPGSRWRQPLEVSMIMIYVADPVCQPH